MGPGDVTGVLPYSRLTVATRETVAESDVEVLSLDLDHFPALIRECPGITEVCVHEMLDRARVFKTSDLQDEKMLSLGKLSAGLAHELNNPAAAVARSARLLQTSMAEADRAARALARVGLGGLLERRGRGAAPAAPGPKLDRDRYVRLTRTRGSPSRVHGTGRRKATAPAPVAVPARAPWRWAWCRSSMGCRGATLAPRAPSSRTGRIGR